MAKTGKSKDDAEFAKNIRKQFDGLFSGEDVPPAPINIRQMKELQARVSELESKLDKQKSTPSGPSLISAQGRPLHHEPVVKPVEVSPVKPKATVVAVDRRELIGRWAALIFAVFSLTLLAFSTYMVYIIGKGQPDLSDRTLEPVAFLMIVASLISYFLIRRNRLGLGSWFLLSIVLIPPIPAVLVLKDIFAVMVLYVAILAPILITWVLSQTARRQAIIATVASLLVIIGIQAWNPAFRLGSSTLPGFTTYLTVLVVLAIGAFFVRQTMAGKISTKLTVLIFVAAVPIFALGAYYISLRGREIIQQQAAKQLQLVNDSIAKDTSAQINFSTQTLGQLALIPDINSMDPERQIPILKAVGTANPEYYLVHVMDRTGEDIARSDANPNANYKDRLYFQVPIGGGPITFQTVIGKTTNRPALTAGLAIRDPQGSVIGVVGVASELTELSSYVNASRVGNTGYAYIVDNHNVVVAHPDPNFTSKLTDLSTYPPIAMMRQNKIGAVTFVDTQSRSWHAYTTVLNNGWGVIVQQQDSEYLQAANTFGNVSMIVLALGLLVLLTVVWLVIGQATRPIALLTKTAAAVAGGDLTRAVPDLGQDEIGIFAKTFGNMTAQLRELVGSLEQRVAERTHDLELASEVGRTITEKVANLSEMLTSAVEMIRARFNLYYTQVYLLDQSGRTVSLRAGTGEVGKQLMQKEHHLTVGPGSINGRAVVEKKPIIVTDTTQSANFLPNPWLPNTRSEMVIPLITGEKLLGVLDMQSEYIGFLNEDNLPVFQTLASQLAIAIQNATLFAEAEQARSEVVAQIRRQTDQGWQEFLNAIERGQKMGFSFDQDSVVALNANALSSSAVENALHVPISITGEQIGLIQLSDEPDRTWTDKEAEIVQAAASQLAQHIENLRLLAQAERYRSEAEQAARRLTREGWDGYLQSRSEQSTDYMFDLNQVQPLTEKGIGASAEALKYPLVVRDEAVGELTVDSVTQSDGSAEIVAAVAQQLSAHLEDLRLSEQTESALNETEALYKTSAEINTSKTYDQILEVLRRYTWLGRDALNVSVSFFDRPWGSGEEPTWINTLASWTSVPSRATVNQYLLSDFPSAREVLHPDTPTLIEDVVNDPRMDENARKLYAVQFGAKSTIFIPLVVSGQWLGYINAMYQQATSFPEAEIRKLMAVVSQAAVAINNIRLLLMTQERVKREQSLREITAAVRSSTNPVTIMRTAVREIGNRLGRKTVVQLSAREQVNQTESTENDGTEPVPPAIHSS